MNTRANDLVIDDENEKLKKEVAELMKKKEELKKELEDLLVEILKKKLEEYRKEKIEELEGEKEVKPWEIETEAPPGDDDESQWKTYTVCTTETQTRYFKVKAPDTYWAAYDVVDIGVPEEPYHELFGDPEVEFVEEFDEEDE